MANFFIDRPIFAWVLAILLCLTGALAIFSLPVEQYPDLAPPNVRITANYPGASAQTLENTVTQVIEQNMTGLDNLMYMSSQSSGTGQATITLSFIAGTDPDEAVQQVQNQLQSAMRKLPQAVQDQGVTVRKTGDTNILTIAFVSTDGSMDKQDTPTTSPVIFRTRSAASTAWAILTLMVHSTLCVSGSIRPN